jgi:oxygen-independent coproporphyrinogen-3 oxidase
MQDTKLKTFAEQIQGFEFHPEVYVYPTPRTYMPISKFSLEDVDFTQEINVYVHIPFCKQICTYCGYLKVVDSKGNLREQYVNALIKEMEMYRNVLQHRTVRTLHFGGGTPSLLSVSELEKIMNALLDINPNILNTADEVSIEATPESVEFEKFSEFKRLGINRVSIGLQTLVDEEIKLCRRNNFFDVSINAIEVLRRVEIHNLVLDLMIGIEGQTVESFETSVRSLLEYKPETVELYAIGLMPNTSLGIRLPHLMSKKDIYKCYDIGRKLFLEAGYQQDCHNRYVIPNRGSFFQEDYLFEGISLVGFGAGTRTYAKNVHYRNNHHRKAHRKAIVEYIRDVESGILPVKSATFLNQEEKMRQYAIYNLESLDKKEFRRLFGISFADRFPGLYSEIIELGLAEEDWRRITLTTKGLNFRDLICKQLFSDNVTQVEEEYRPK